MIAPLVERFAELCRGNRFHSVYGSHWRRRNANGAMVARTARDTSEDETYANERLETYAYDALGLIERFTVKSQQAKVSVDGDCALTASNAPINDWRYRFSPMSEREQKRQYAHFNDSNALAWTYYMLGADAKQLSTWNGVEGDHCAETNTVWLWPVERNGFGPANTRIIIRQDSTREFVVTDHLGSTRLVINSNKDKLEEHNYEPFGGTIKHEGIAARTSYIGRETDTESDLGAYGVRMYSQEYGRFVSCDPLWSSFPSLTPFVYSYNSPVDRIDPTGRAGEAPWFVHSSAEAGGGGDTRYAKPSTANVGALAFGGMAIGISLNPIFLVAGALSCILTGDQPIDRPKLASATDAESAEGAQDSPQEGEDANTNPFAGPVSKPVIIVTPEGNAVPVGAGESLQGSKDGHWIQGVKNGEMTGVRIDWGHPGRHPGTAGAKPHAHIPGVTNPDGTPWRDTSKCCG